MQSSFRDQTSQRLQESPSPDRVPMENRSGYRPECMENVSTPFPAGGQMRQRSMTSPLAITTHPGSERWAAERLRSSQSQCDDRRQGSARDWPRGRDVDERRWGNSSGYWAVHDYRDATYDDSVRKWPNSGSPSKPRDSMPYRREGEFDNPRSHPYRRSGEAPSPPSLRQSSRPALRSSSPAAFPSPPLPAKSPSENASKVRDPRLLSGRVASANVRPVLSPKSSASSAAVCSSPSDNIPPSKVLGKANDFVHPPKSSFAPAAFSTSTASIAGHVRSNVSDVVSNKLSEDMDATGSTKSDDESPGMIEEKQVYACQHCSYVGKKIVPHYVNRHPGKEVPVRMNMDEFEEALEEQKAPPTTATLHRTVDKPLVSSSIVIKEKPNLEDLSWIPERSIFLRPVDCKICGSYTTVVRTNLLQHVISHRNPEKNSIGLQFATPTQFHCRFCEYSATNVQDFRDHVTAHTGEFLYTCGYCSFRGFSSKSVRSHIGCSHLRQAPFVKRGPDVKLVGSLLMGFVCKKCRFVQLSETSVREHVKVSHSRDKVEVLQINMSRNQKLVPKKLSSAPELAAVSTDSPASPLPTSMNPDNDSDDDVVVTKEGNPERSRTIPLEVTIEDSPASPEQDCGIHEGLLMPTKIIKLYGEGELSDNEVTKTPSPSVVNLDSDEGALSDEGAPVLLIDEDAPLESNPIDKLRTSSETEDKTRKEDDTKEMEKNDETDETKNSKSDQLLTSISSPVELDDSDDEGGTGDAEDETSSSAEDETENDGEGDNNDEQEESSNSSEQWSTSDDEKLAKSATKNLCKAKSSEDDNDCAENPDHSAPSPGSSGSPPHLFPENTLDDDDEASDGKFGSLAPSIAETILRLQATLKKQSGKRSSLPPPVLEPVDANTNRDQQASQPAIAPERKAEAEKSTWDYVYKCGAKRCGFYTTKEEEFVSHLDSSHTPREAPCSECGGSFAQWKLLFKHLAAECVASERTVRFVCGFRSCYYYTSNEELFSSHVRWSHKKETQLPCRNCQKNFTLVTSLLNHIKGGCKADKMIPVLPTSAPHQISGSGSTENSKLKTNDNVVNDKNSSESQNLEFLNKISNAVDPAQLLHTVYQCPFVDCDHKSLEREVFQSHVASLHADCQLCCRHCQKELENIEALIVHIETHHSDGTDVEPHGRKRRCDSDTSDTASKMSKLQKEASLPPTDTIASENIVLLDDKADSVTIQNTSNIEESVESSEAANALPVDSRDTSESLSLAANSKLAKTLKLEMSRVQDPAVEGLSMKKPSALVAQLDAKHLQCLFKCMGQSCPYSSEVIEEFVLHLTAGTCDSRLVCCYCLYESNSAKTVGEHVVAHHGHCTFQCKYCFYRSATEEYVSHHQQRRHPGLAIGFLDCKRHPDAQDPLNEPVNPEFVIPYRCAVDTCQYEVADPDEFRKHNQDEHGTVCIFPCHHCGVTCSNPDRLLSHYKIHGCNNYQCGYCLHGSETDDEILFHLCSMHPNRRGRLIVRAVVNNKFLSSARTVNEKVELSSKKLNLILGSEVESVTTKKGEGTTLSTAKVNDTLTAQGDAVAGPSTPSKDVKKDGKVGHALFQCGYPPCSFSASTAEALREHMVTCTCSRKHPSAKCPHCPRQWRTVTVFLEHMVTQHGGRRFVCGRCPFRGATPEYVQNHLKLQHGIPLEQTECVLRDPTADPEVGEYMIQEVVASPVPAREKPPEQIRKTERKVVQTRRGLAYGVHDMDRLPLQSIFTREVHCSLCGYATKVRSNLARHLQLHRRENKDLDDASPTSTPTKKKSISETKASPTLVSVPIVKSVALPEVISNTEQKPNIEPLTLEMAASVPEFTIDSDTSNCPQFIAATSLYRCGVDSCDYLALDNVMYRYHVNTLHPDKGAYPCPHCKERLTSLDRLINHFRMHGPRLYKCGKCSYISYRRHPVEAHNSSAHNNRFLPVVTVREPTASEVEKSAEPVTPDVVETTTTTTTTPMPATKLRIQDETNTSSVESATVDDRNIWCCALCKHLGPTKMLIKNHLQSSHGVRSEFKCGICSCVSNAFEGVRLHFVARHPNLEVQIMPLIVKTKEYDPDKLLVTVPKDSPAKPDSVSPAKPTRSSIGPPRESPRGSITTRASAAAAENAALTKESPIPSLRPQRNKAKVTTPEQPSTQPQNGLKLKIDLKTRSRSTSRDSPQQEDSTTPGTDTKRIIKEKHEAPATSIKSPTISPAAGKVIFECPICHDYKTKFRGDMRIHIYRELQYRRVECQLCKTTFVSEKEAKHHSQKTHRGRSPSLIKHEDPEKEDWVKEQLDSQVRAWGSVPRKNAKNRPEEAEVPPVFAAPDVVEEADKGGASTSEAVAEEDPADPSSQAGERYFRYSCPQCNYQCEGTTDLRKHIFRHMKFKPFQCQFCDQRFSEKQQIRNHHLQQHADEEFYCERDTDQEPERYVDELLQLQRVEWKDKKKTSVSPPVAHVTPPRSVRLSKTIAQIAVAKMAEESEVTVTSKSGTVHKMFSCKYEGCNFTCDQIKGLKVHLMSHMRLPRFRCGYCSLTGSSQYQMRRHCLSVHAGRRVLVVSLKSEESPALPAATPTPATASTPKISLRGSGSALPHTRSYRQHQCRYCSYTHTLPKMILRHQMRHYVEKPFQCGYCKRTGIEKFDVLSHCRKVHPEHEPKVISTPIPSNPEIRPILRRGHNLSKSSPDDKEESDDIGDDIPLDKIPLEHTLKSEAHQGEQSGSMAQRTRRIYQCNLCQARLNSKEEIKSHLTKSHDESGPRYRVIVTARKSTPAAGPAAEGTGPQSGNLEATRLPLLKCIYCDLASDSLKLLRKHCHETHVGNEVRLLKLALDWEPVGESTLRCGYCGFVGVKTSNIWDHHFSEHAGKSVKLRVSMRKNASGVKGRKGKAAGSGSQPYLCVYCNDPCESLEKVVRHWQMFHAHLELKYKGPNGEEETSLADKVEVVLDEGADSNDEGEKVSKLQVEVPLVSSNSVGVKVYGCAQCKYESDKYDMVRQHLFRHLMRFQCSKCQKCYPFEYEMKKHFETHHSGQKLEITKNPNYKDHEKEDLIKNIRIRIDNGVEEDAIVEHVDAQQDMVSEALEIVMENDDPVSVTTSTASNPLPVSRQVARKSFKRSSEIPGTLGQSKMPCSKMSAKKSTSSKIKPASLKWQLLKESIAETMPQASKTDIVEDVSPELEDKKLCLVKQDLVVKDCVESTNTNSDILSGPPAKVAKLESPRISLSLLDLYEMVDLKPVINLKRCDGCNVQRTQNSPQN